MLSQRLSLAPRLITDFHCGSSVTSAVTPETSLIDSYVRSRPSTNSVPRQTKAEADGFLLMALLPALKFEFKSFKYFWQYDTPH
jgi:hypothetical protein